MSKLSLTACSFHLRKKNLKGNEHIYYLNSSIDVKTEDNGYEKMFPCAQDLIADFINEHRDLKIDEDDKKSFQCIYDEKNYVETDDFIMMYIQIFSGIYGSSSDILDGDSKEITYKKKASDIDTKPFYLMIVFPKDSYNTKVQKGMFIFQNVGQFGIKTITTSLMQKYFSEKYGITIKCKTIAPELFIRKVLVEDNIKKLIMIKNYKSSDLSDNLSKGYGKEVREISKLSFSTSVLKKVMDKIRYMAGNKFSLFEFEQVEYDKLKVSVELAGHNRIIDLHNLENLSIIENIPDEIRKIDGHPVRDDIVRYFTKVANEYLTEMVLEIT